MQSLRLRPRELYRVRTEERAKTGLQEMGLFSYSSIQFTPRSVQTLDSLGNVVYRDTLDANIDLVFDKPYDFYVEANARGKTTGRVGPELVVGLTKRNAFMEARNLLSTCMVRMSGKPSVRLVEVLPASIPMNTDRMFP